MEQLEAALTLDARIGQRLRALRAERAWSLDDVAGRTGISRASLSRLENAEVSPTASMLGRLCAAYGMTLSRLMHQAEGDFQPLVGPASQPVWVDPSVAFERRSVSPPAQTLAGEVLECLLGAGVSIDYDAPPRPGLEHHLVLVDGRLAITIDGRRFDLQAGDCLRYLLFGPSRFETPETSAARYLLFMV
jgi:transcriptional regulator with XRE-family HTH domain